MASTRWRTPLTASAILALSLAAAMLDCGAGTASSTATSPRRAFVEAPFAKLELRAGTQFRARLDAPLSSETSREGELFSATLDEPLIAVDGSTVAPKGTRLRGQILRVERGAAPRIVLRFDTLEVGGHFLPIHAQVMRIESGFVVPTDAADANSTAASLYPQHAATLPTSGMGGGPPPEELPIQIRQGSFVELYLSRPFVVERALENDAP